MDLTEKKQKNQYNEDAKKIDKIFKFDKINLLLKGSYGLSRLNYYADYDFWVIVNHNYSKKEIYEEFKTILKLILDDLDTYFIEFKIQNLDGDKYKLEPNQLFNYDDFKKKFKQNIEFCKIDIVLWSENQKKFIEVSVNYWFNMVNKKNEIAINELKESIKELKKENNYFKILKKIFSIENLKQSPDKIKNEKIINFFNSEIGKIYIDINNIDAIEKVKKYYGNEALTKKRIELNLNEIKYYENYKKQYDKNKQKMNDEAKKLYEQL